MSPTETLLVIVPTYNERENLPEVVQRVLKADPATHLLVVDDNSPDGTGDYAEELSKSNRRIHLLKRNEKLGLGRAYIAGFQWGLDHGYDLIMEMDGDLSHNPSDIPAFRAAARHADLILGSRYKQGIRVINWPLGRLLLSLSAAQYVRAITGMPFTDPTGGYKLFRAETLRKIDFERIHSNGYSFQIELTHLVWRQGLRVSEIPIIFTDRFQGASKMSRSIVYEAVGIVWRLLLQNKLRRRPA